MDYVTRSVQCWGNFWSSPVRRREFIVSLAVLTAIMLGTLRFMHYNETRPGTLLADPLLAAIPPVDLSNLTFFLLYAGLIVTVIMLLPHPEKLSFGMQVYALYACLRVLAMWLVPLDPPEGMIQLADPVLSWAQTGKQLNKDLFFSGHTATIYLCHLLMPSGQLRKVYLLGVMLMAACLVIQRVHYSADVIAAPFVCYGSLRIIQILRGKLGLDAQLG